MKKLIQIIAFCFFVQFSWGAKILIPMNAGDQANHLKAYGIAFWILQNDIEMHWLLNYEGGAFMVDHYKTIEEELIIRGVSYKTIADVKAQQILNEIGDPEKNQEAVKLHKSPKVAVYSPGGKMPWDDAVTLVLTYAEIPYDIIYDSAIVSGVLPEYDWLHLHHEDFTGQYGKFYRSYKNAPWYRKQQSDSESQAKRLGFTKVSEMKKAVALNIRNYTAGGGFLFTMCSGTDSYDIALAAQHTDICHHVFDGDPPSPNAQNELKFEESFAFQDYRLHMDPMEYEFSDIDATKTHRAPENQDKFTLFDFSAKWDVVPTMLCQNHTNVVNGFMGQTTDFHKKYIKSNVLIMGENKALGTAKYIHGNFGKGQWTFYGGHDPEDFRHFVGDPPTDLNLFPNSPGYRLILNNILFPAAKKKKQKT